MDSAGLCNPSHEAQFLNLPLNARWEPLKPVIVQLYTKGKDGPGGKSMTMRQVADFMRDKYSFHAAINQYEHILRAWGVRKRMLAKEKEETASALGRRKHPGTSSSKVTLDQGGLNKQVDKKQLKRYLKDQIRHHQMEEMVPGILSSWNLPYKAYVASYSNAPNAPSPFGKAVVTPGYINIDSPEAITPRQTTPGQSTDLSPAMQLVRKKNIQDRSNLLIQGRIKELLISCGEEDRILLTNYFHDFFVHSFVTAKHWLKGPKVWTAGMISALTLDSWDSAISPTSTPGPSPSAPSGWIQNFNAPTQFCRWSIHVENTYYTPIKEEAVNGQDEFDLQDPSSWSRWPEEDTTFLDAIRGSITDSTFTRISPESLPISTQLIQQTLQKEPDSLQLDAWKFAIMAGNVELLERLAENITDRIYEIHLFHIAANFLDGGNTCCTVFHSLQTILGADYLFYHNVDDLGHTVLDTLMISILRSHTKVQPKHVSASFNDRNNYPGEEKDVCGRWDADSPNVRKLFQSGNPHIPDDWKHPFCHTAVQAMVHCTMAIFGSSASPNINTLSGLFVRRCSNCGLELRLGPLHTLVVVAFYLAYKGMPGETLFGVLALLVCLLRLGADASLTATISIEDILETTESGRCYHTSLSAFDLMEAVPEDITNYWSNECQAGWICLLQTFRLAKDGNNENNGNERVYNRGFTNSDLMDPDSTDSDSTDSDSTDSDSTDSDLRGCPAHDDYFRLICGYPELGLLWAAIQVEILTYRRIDDGAPWVSNNFSMETLKLWLKGESAEFDTPLVKMKMMKEHSICGWFRGRDFIFPIAEEVCSEYFMNMDVYNRATYLERCNFMELWVDTR